VSNFEYCELYQITFKGIIWAGKTTALILLNKQLQIRGWNLYPLTFFEKYRYSSPHLSVNFWRLSEHLCHVLNSSQIIVSVKCPVCELTSPQFDWMEINLYANHLVTTRTVAIAVTSNSYCGFLALMHRRWLATVKRKVQLNNLLNPTFLYETDNLQLMNKSLTASVCFGELNDLVGFIAILSKYY